MNRATSRLPAVLRERARLLDEHGSSGLAWSAADAMRVLRAFDNTDVAILGGDVLLEEADGRIVFTYDNWHCDRNGPFESISQYATRSRTRAHQYIQSYRGRAEPLFRLVMTDEPTAGLTRL
jgi:hypothetical protein